MKEIFVGVDVSKRFLDVAVRPSGQTIRFDLQSVSVSEVAEQVRELGPSLVVIEASGGYERAIVASLCETKVPVCVVNPRQVRDFAKAAGKLAKTDRIDSTVLAQFAEAMRPTAFTMPSATASELTALVVRRRQLVA